jgi:hypothetical protein
VREADGRKIEGFVNAAYLLARHLPGATHGYRDTPMPARLLHPEYRRSFCFGTVTLQPGMMITDIATMLKGVIADAATRS